MAKQRTKSGRSGRRRPSDRWEMRLYPGPEPGPGVTGAPVEAVIAAMQSFDPDAPWDDLRHAVLPMFERRRPLPPGSPSPLTVVLPPGVTTGFGIDLGPALARISPDLVERWGISTSEVVETAIRNLRWAALELAAPDVVEGSVGGAPLRLFRSDQGWASTLILDAQAMRHVLGPEPCLVTAPMRDCLLAFPIDVDRDLARFVTEELEALDPNALALEAFVWRGGITTCAPLRDAASA